MEPRESDVRPESKGGSCKKEKFPQEAQGLRGPGTLGLKISTMTQDGEGENIKMLTMSSLIGTIN